jgi:hypothetical protein
MIWQRIKRLRIKKESFSFRSPHRMSQLLSSLETKRQRREEIRRIILKKKGGYRVDTDVEICLVYGLTSLI